MSSVNQSQESSTDTEQKTSIKKLLKQKDLNPKRSEDLKYLLSLSLLPKMNKFNFNFHSLISLLLKYKTPKNEQIFYDFFFQSCELSKIGNVKILLEHKFDINRQNELGETPLHIAVAKNDEELVKLIIKHEPRTDLLTYKDGFTVMNYAEICGNSNIIKLVDDLNQKNLKNKIKSEVVDLIKKDMMNININNMSCFSKSKNFDEIQNYNGEKISTILNEDTNTNNNMSSMSKISNKMNIKNKNDEKNCINTITIINDSESFDDSSPKNINNIINSSNNNNNKNINLLPPESPKNIYFPSPTKKKECTSSIKSSYLQSLKTCHTLSKEHELSPIYKNYKSNFPNLFNKKNDLIKFISEINLPQRYTEIMIENGFDDLVVLTNQMKKGLALSYQNLKDIGINNPGDRAKILIHLEEISKTFDFIIESDVIYNNIIPEEKNGSLYYFLQRLNLEEYFNTFIENGYNTAELLFIQMASKNPITEEIIKNDLGIDKIGHLQRIMISLKEESKKYIESLTKRENNDTFKNVIYEENPYLNSCDACSIF